MFTIVRARTRKQIADAQRVRYKVYCEQDGKFKDCVFPGKMMKISHDDEPSTIIIVAYYRRKPVGTISVFAHSRRLGLPIEETITALKNEFELKKFIEQREFETPLYSCGMLAIDQDFRGTTKISIWLYRLAFEWARRQGCKDIVATINHKIEKTVLLIGFKHLLPNPWYSEDIGNTIFLMYAKISELAKNLELQSVPDWCREEFAGSNKVGIWGNEDIVRYGMPGNEFFLIIEGSAKVVARTPNICRLLAVLPQGSTFGEMALFSGKRTATVLSDAYCVTKILSYKDVMSIVKDVEKAKGLVRILIDRLIEMNKKVKNGFPYSNFFASIFPKKAIKSLPVKTFVPDEIICQAGEDGNTAYLVKSGQIGIVVPKLNSNVIVTTMTPPALFGYMVFFNKFRTASVIALEKTELYVIGEKKFWEIFSDSRSRKKLIKNLLELIAFMNVGISKTPERENFCQNIKNWIINYFKTVDLQEKISISGNNIVDQISPLTVEIAAKGLGTSLEEMGTLLDQLKEGGILDQKQGEFSLLDEERLKEFKFNL